MHLRLLQFLCCPDCGADFTLDAKVDDEETQTGLLSCSNGHAYPIVGGIPRIYPEAMIRPARPFQESTATVIENPVQRRQRGRVRESFSREWGHHEVGDRTWYLDMPTRVKEVFLDAIRIPGEELANKVVLDAGCGNGSQCAAYTEHVGEVIGLDLSSGVDVGLTYRRLLGPERASRLHFLQADLLRPPIKPASVDIIHSMGVLHHTPDTHRAFQALVPLLKPDGTLYLWLYRYEPVVTPVLTAIRAVTTRIPPRAFDRVARFMAPAFVLFTRFTTWTGVRTYPMIHRREAALALIDIFGAPFAHHHSVDEVTGWLRERGFNQWWLAHQSRRGFGIGARLSASPSRFPVRPVRPSSRPE